MSSRAPHTADVPWTDVEYEVVDDGSGHGPGRAYGVPRPGGLGGPLPGVLGSVLAQLASGVLRGNEAPAVALALRALGYARDGADLQAYVAANEDALNGFFQRVDLQAVVRDALSDPSGEGPGLYACAGDRGAALPLLGAGALAGFLITKILGSDG